MVRKNFDVEVPDGQHLGFSRDTDGAFRAHLFDNETNDLVGHAELFETADENIRESYVYSVPEPAPGTSEGGALTDEELADLLRALVGLGIIAAAFAAEKAPHVRKWWDGSAVPVIRAATNHTVKTIGAAWKNVTSTWKAAQPSVSPALRPDDGADREAPSTELNIAFKKYRTSMDSAEARERFVAALVARAFSEEQMRILRDANIERDSGSGDLREAIEALSPHQVGKTITLMLEKNPTLTTQATLAELRKILTGHQIDGRPTPLVIGLSPMNSEQDST